MEEKSPDTIFCSPPPIKEAVFIMLFPSPPAIVDDPPKTLFPNPPITDEY